MVLVGLCIHAEHLPPKSVAAGAASARGAQNILGEVPQTDVTPGAVALVHAEHLPEELGRRFRPLQDSPSLRDPRGVPMINE